MEAPRPPVVPSGATGESSTKARWILTRPKGVRPRDMRLPKGVDRSMVVSILTGSSYQVAARVWLMKGQELAARIIIDTGSGASLIREDLLPTEVSVQTRKSHPPPCLT